MYEILFLLLSGGLDSAVVAVLLKQILEEQGKEFHTFSVGENDSPDITAARMMS
jgi:asparagine synthase (glutamine-hydrolysing)